MPGRQPDRDRVLATVLFTDIVASTEHAARVGDAAWRELLARHHAAVRRELRRYGGREQDTAGDGFFATFERPLAALRCAAAIVAAAAPLGLRERAALHSGELERMEGKLGGIAVHTAARLLTLAGPGEVLVSATTRELVAGAGLRFVDRGTQPLRGLPEPVHAYALEDPEALAAESAQPAAPAPPTRLRLATVTGGIAIVAVLALVIAAFASRGVGGEPGSSGSPGGRGSAGSLAATSPAPSVTEADFPGNLPPAGKPIAPGTYLMSFIRGGPAMTFPDGWQRTLDGDFLSPVSYPYTHLSFRQWEPPATDPCGVDPQRASPTPSPAVSAPASDTYTRWLAWLTHHPALRTTQSAVRTFNGIGATQFEVEVLADRACQLGGPPRVAIGGAAFFNFTSGLRTRVYLIDSATPILVILEAPSEAEFDLAVPDVEAMLLSLHFPE